MKPLALVPTLLLCTAPGLVALDHFVVGPRAQGMAGANVASTNDESAQYYNPGAFGFMAAANDGQGEGNERDNNQTGRRDFALGFDASMQYRLTGALSELLDEIEEVDLDRLGTIGSGNDITAGDIDMIVRMVSLLPRLDDPDTQAQFLINGGAGVQVGRLAVGVRNFTGITAQVREIDTDNLGIDYSDMTALSDAIEQADTDDDIVPDGYSPQLITGGQADRMLEAGYTQEAISVIDYELSQNVGTGLASQALTPAYVDILVDAAEVVEGVNPGGGPIEDNTTAVTARGVGWIEIPVSYGYQINDRISVGLSAKYMLGRVYGASVRVFDEDSEIEDVIDDALDDYEESTAFGIDAGVMLRLDGWQFGLVGRNLNSPEFDGFYSERFDQRFDDAELDPELTVGAAWIPTPTLTVEGALDLLEQESFNGGYDHRYLSAGVEWDAFRFLALRGGISTNLAEDDIGPTIDLGVGLNLGLLRLDLAAGAALDTEEFDGNTIPKEGHVSFGLSSRW